MLLPGVNAARGSVLGAPATILIALLSLGAATATNAVVSGSRPSPYGFYVPSDRLDALLQRHSLAVWLDRPTTLGQFGRDVGLGQVSWDALRSFNRELGLELPDREEAEMPLGVPIWLPPRAPDAGTCCVWILSQWDGWVSTRTEGYGVEWLEPTSAHAAGNSGSIGVQIYAVPMVLQQRWAAAVSARPPWIGSEKDREALFPPLRALLERVRSADWDSSLCFSFGQWVADRSKVARMVVSLPLAEVDGEVKFAEQPQVRWLDAYGKDTSPRAPEESLTFLVLVSVTGGAFLGYLVFALRRRATGSPA